MIKFVILILVFLAVGLAPALPSSDDGMIFESKLAEGLGRTLLIGAMACIGLLYRRNTNVGFGVAAFVAAIMVMAGQFYMQSVKADGSQDLEGSSEISSSFNAGMEAADAETYSEGSGLRAAEETMEVTLADIEEPSQPRYTYNPSFHCGARLSNVEAMICQDQQLAILDRELSDRYFKIKAASPADLWAQIRVSQREFLRRRSVCADQDCIHQAYATQSMILDRMTDGLEY